MSPIKIRVCAILQYEDVVLLVQSKNGLRGNYWVLPGGILEKGETLEACLKREMQEELGIEVEDPRLLFIGDNLNTKQPNEHHLVEVYFLVNFHGRPKPHSEIVKCRFFDRHELEGIDFRPVGIKDLIYKKDISGYLGNLYMG